MQKAAEKTAPVVEVQQEDKKPVKKAGVKNANKSASK